MRTEDIAYSADGVRMVGQYVVDDTRPGRRAGVLVCHEGPGLTEHTKEIAARLAGLGYAAFAMDYYGDGKPLANPADSAARLAPWRADPTGIRIRATAATTTTAAATVKAIVGFHSGLATARPQDASNIKAKVLVCIGADDPIIPPVQRTDFEAEMKAAGIDWRLQLYGGVGHSFTNPAVDARGMKGFFFHEATNRRAWNAMIELFNEALGGA